MDVSLLLPPTVIYVVRSMPLIRMVIFLNLFLFRSLRMAYAIRKEQLISVSRSKKIQKLYMIEVI